MIIIGLGNRFREDDAAGLHVARRLQTMALPGVPVVVHDGDLIDLLPIWAGHDNAILIDALSALDETGRFRLLDPDIDPAPDIAAVVSSHGHSLWDVLDLSRIMGARPARVLIYAIAGRRFGVGEGLSPGVEHAIDEVVTSILATVSQYTLDRARD